MSKRRCDMTPEELEKARAYHREYYKRYYELHPEKQAEIRARYMEKNREKERARQARYRQENRSKTSARLRERYWANPEKYRADRRAYHVANAEKEANTRAAWYRANRKDILARAKASRDNDEFRRKHCEKVKKSYVRKRTAVVTALTAAQGGVCYLCGNTLDMSCHIDHIHPVARGGSNEIENLAAACRECNRRKSHTPLDVYIARAGLDGESVYARLDARRANLTGSIEKCMQSYTPVSRRKLRLQMVSRSMCKKHEREHTAHSETLLFPR